MAREWNEELGKFVPDAIPRSERAMTTDLRADIETMASNLARMEKVLNEAGCDGLARAMRDLCRGLRKEAERHADHVEKAIDAVVLDDHLDLDSSDAKRHRAAVHEHLGPWLPTPELRYVLAAFRRESGRCRDWNNLDTILTRLAAAIPLAWLEVNDAR